MKKFLLVLFAIFLAPGAWAAELPELLMAGPDAGTGQGFVGAVSPGVYPVRINAKVREVAAGSELKLTLPDRAFTVVFERSQQLPSGNLSWVGYLKEAGKDYRVILTTGDAGTSGRILTPDGEYLIEPSEAGDRLINLRETGMKAAPLGEDEKTPPMHDPDILMSVPSPNAFAATPSPQTTIDVLVLYTPGLTTKLGAALQTRLDQLVTLANQAYVDSEVAVTLRLVHSEQISYTDLSANSAALDDLTDGVGTLSGVAALRNTYGADLVVLLRPYKKDYNNGCGIAWVPWVNGQVVSSQSSYGYSVVSDGSDGNYYCVDYTFAHELGHNMGSKHDRANNSSGGYGAYSYSFGYGISGNFGTIMSYIDPVIGRFSNPYLSTCNGLPCGVSESNTTSSANNALSLNNTRTIVAAFRNAVAANPGVLQFTASASSVAENGGAAVLTVARTGGSSGAASVNYATVAGTALAGGDFTAVSGTLNWADGETTSKTISVTILDDANAESSETFAVSLSGASGASLSTPASVTVTITDNDSAQPASDCASSLAPQSSNLILNIPIISLGGGTYVWADLLYVPSTDGQLWFVLADLGSANPAAFTCTPPAFGSQGEIVLPDMMLGTQSYWVKLLYIPTTDAYYWFKVYSYALN